ncbi:MAG TPA: TRAP transporter substrate-binding protein DctP [Hyphomonadaceae bacterium]
MKRIAALALLLLAACGARDNDGVIVLSYGSQYSPSHPFSRADIAWMNFVSEESKGAIRIKPYWGGGLLSAEESMLEVRHGVVDIGLVTPIYLRAGAHMLRTQAGFYGGSRGYDDQLAVYRCISEEFPDFAHEMAGLKVFAVQGGNLPGVLTRSKPVATLEDFRGLRLRAPVELTPVLKELGADPVNMPMGEVYSALAKGVIDGVVAPADTLQSLHFNEVAKHFSTVTFARGAYPARAMSLEVWDRLPAGAKDVLERSIPVWEEAMKKEITSAQQKGEDFGRETGINFVAFDARDQARLDEIYNAQALKEAQRLTSVDGGDAAPVLRRAQQVVAALKAGETSPCSGSQP